MIVTSNFLRNLRERFYNFVELTIYALWNILSWFLWLFYLTIQKMIIFRSGR